MTEALVTASGTDRYTVPALQRGLQLLMQFSREERELSGADLARRLALPRASVFRMLQTLEQMGFVERLSDGASYRLGLGVLRLGFEALASMDLVEQARPVLERLRDATGLSAHLVMREGGDVLVVAKAPGASALFAGVQVGTRLPAHATVLGRVLLGGLSMSDMARAVGPEPLKVFTDRTPITHADLAQRVAHDAEQGFGVSEGGFETGISTVAAPVFDAQRRVSAALSVTVPASRIEAEQRTLLVAQVQSAAAELSMSRPAVAASAATAGAASL